MADWISLARGDPDPAAFPIETLIRCGEDSLKRVQLPATLAIVQYRQRRNYAAYRSRRKRTRSRLNHRPPKRRKRYFSS